MSTITYAIIFPLYGYGAGFIHIVVAEAFGDGQRRCDFVFIPIVFLDNAPGEGTEEPRQQKKGLL
jgi:hypothetical protein